MTTIRRIFSSTVVKVMAIIFGVFMLLLVGLVAGVVLTNLGFNNERAKIQELQTQLEEAEASADELAEVTARAEEAESQLEEAQAEIEDLQAINDSLEERIKNLQDGLTTAAETPSENGSLAQDYVSWKFWTDGNQYQATDEGTVFYADPDYETGLETNKVILVSRVVSPDKLEVNGEIVTVYTALSTEGFVYCRDVPNLEIVQ